MNFGIIDPLYLVVSSNRIRPIFMGSFFCVSVGGVRLLWIDVRKDKKFCNSSNTFYITTIRRYFSEGYSTVFTLEQPAFLALKIAICAEYSF